MEEKKSPGTLVSLLEGILKLVSGFSKYSIEEFLEEACGELPKEIVKMESEQKIEFVGGKTYVEYVDDRNFRLSFNMYFRDPNSDAPKKSTISENVKLSVLNQSSIEELKSKGKIEFDITPPTSEERDKILREIKK